MNCYECNNDYKKQKNAKYRVDDEFIGTFYVDDVEVMKCGKCGEILLSPESLAKIENEEARILDARLQAMPIRAFLSSAETATILGISRQALHKHRRISRGFIFQTSFGGSKVYLNKSIERFRVHGDGRFKLFKETEAEFNHAPILSSNNNLQMQSRQLDEFSHDRRLLPNLQLQPQSPECFSKRCS